jgi:hypothetical protein
MLTALVLICSAAGGPGGTPPLARDRPTVTPVTIDAAAAHPRADVPILVAAIPPSASGLLPGMRRWGNGLSG